MVFKKLAVLETPEDRSCAFEILGSIVEYMKCSESIRIFSPNRPILFNIPHYPNDVIYFDRRNIYISERTLMSVISNDTYLRVEDIVDILDKTRIDNKRILGDNFYKELVVKTPVGVTTVDTLVFNRKILTDFLSSIKSYMAE